MFHSNPALLRISVVQLEGPNFWYLSCSSGFHTGCHCFITVYYYVTIFQLFSPTTHLETPGGEEQEDLPAGEGERSHLATMASECAARGYGTYSTRQQSGSEGDWVSSTPTPSLVWWYQPWSHYWASLAFYCVGCQGKGLGQEQRLE